MAYVFKYIDIILRYIAFCNLILSYTIKKYWGLHNPICTRPSEMHKFTMYKLNELLKISTAQ